MSISIQWALSVTYFDCPPSSFPSLSSLSLVLIFIHYLHHRQRHRALRQRFREHVILPVAHDAAITREELGSFR